MKYYFEVIMVMIYNLTLVSGTVYLVQFYDWNPWWFLLTVGMMVSVTKD
jgi:hypothetical protein